MIVKTATRASKSRFGAPARGRAAAGLGAALALALPGAALAAPMYDCDGTGVVVDSYSDAVLSPDGHVACVMENGATLNLYDGMANAAIPLGSTTTMYDYSERGLSSDNGSPQIETHYDTDNRLVTVTDPTDTTVYDRYQYDGPSSLLVETTDPAGHVTQYTYDARNRQVTEIDPLGNTTQTQYDSMDRLVREYDPTGDVTRYEFQYDSMNRLAVVTDGTDDLTKFIYNPTGQVIDTIDPLGTTQYFYDDGLLSYDIDPLGDVTRFVYDAAGQMTGDTDPAGTTTRFVYTSQVPEPGSLALLLTALSGAAGVRKRRRR